MDCCNNYVSAFDPETGEVVCASCGVVNQQETEMASHLSTVEQQREASSEDHNITNMLLMVENGSVHGYGVSGQGIGFKELGNPRARDFAGKRVKKTVIKDGYNVPLSIDRNGYFRNDGKFVIDYTRDKWFIALKQMAYQICSEQELDVIASNKVGSMLKKLYSTFLISPDCIPELFVRMVIQDLPDGLLEKDFKEKNAARLVFLSQKLTSMIEPYLQHDEYQELEAMMAK